MTLEEYKQVKHRWSVWGIGFGLSIVNLLYCFFSDNYAVILGVAVVSVVVGELGYRMPQPELEKK